MQRFAVPDEEGIELDSGSDIACLLAQVYQRALSFGHRGQSGRSTDKPSTDKLLQQCVANDPLGSGAHCPVAWVLQLTETKGNWEA